MVQMSPETRGISTSISSIVAATNLVFQASCLLPLKAGLCKNIISLSISIGPSISSITVCCKPPAVISAAPASHPAVGVIQACNSFIT